MKSGSIKINCQLDTIWDCGFKLTASNRATKSSAHFYGDADTWKAFGKQLIDFPATDRSRVVFEQKMGGELPVLLLEVNCDGPSGGRIKVILDNQGDHPWRRCRAEFSILVEPASINRFGQQLLNWNVEDKPELRWEAQTS